MPSWPGPMADENDTIDTGATRLIRGSPLKLVLFLALGVALTAMCLALAFDLLPLDGEDREAGWLFGWIGGVFFGGITLVLIRRVLAWKQVVIEISPEGLRDRRLGNHLILWQEVTDIGIWSARASSFVQLAVTEAAENRLFRSPGSRLMALANKGFGFSGVAINAAGTETDNETLARICDAYWRAYSNS